MQGENPLHASPKPELVQKSLDHLLSQGQEILISGAKVSFVGKCSRRGVNKHREQRNKGGNIFFFCMVVAMFCIRELHFSHWKQRKCLLAEVVTFPVAVVAK